MEKNSRNYQMDSENYQNLTLHNPSCLLAKKNLWSETPIRTSLWIIISKNTSQFYETSWEILRFVRDIRDNFCKTFSIFFYRLPVCYHDIITNFMDFWLILIFVEFKIYSSTSHYVLLRDQDVQIFLSIDWQCLKLD